MKLDDLIHDAVGELSEILPHQERGFVQRLRNSKISLIILAAVVIALQVMGIFKQLSSTTLDAATVLPISTTAQHVILVLINDEDYAKYFNSRSPLDVAKLREILEIISGFNPRMIAVDLDTTDPMFQQLHAPPNLAFLWGTLPVNIESANGFVLSPALGGSPEASQVALTMLPSDEHGVIRSYCRFFRSATGSKIPSFAVATRAIYKNEDLKRRLNDPSDNEQFLDFRYNIEHISLRALYDMADMARKPATAANLRRHFYGKLVILGGAYDAARDKYVTPVGKLAGAEILAQATECEIGGTGISRVSRWLTALVEIFGGLIIIFVNYKLSLRDGILISICAIPVLSLLSGLILFHRLAMWTAMVPVIIAVLITEVYAKTLYYLAVCKVLLTKTTAPVKISVRSKSTKNETLSS